MTRRRSLKRRIRARMARTGESYTTARRHVINRLEAESRPVGIAPVQRRERAKAAPNMDRRRGAGARGGGDRCRDRGRRRRREQGHRRSICRLRLSVVYTTGSKCPARRCCGPLNSPPTTLRLLPAARARPDRRKAPSRSPPCRGRVAARIPTPQRGRALSIFPAIRGRFCRLKGPRVGDEASALDAGGRCVTPSRDASTFWVWGDCSLRFTPSARWLACSWSRFSCWSAPSGASGSRGSRLSRSRLPISPPSRRGTTMLVGTWVSLRDAAPFSRCSWRFGSPPRALFWSRSQRPCGAESDTARLTDSLGARRAR